jgi:hypothetical protein
MLQRFQQGRLALQSFAGSALGLHESKGRDPLKLLQQSTQVALQS